MVCFSFPACHFGKLYGLVMSISALFSLLQYPCFTLVKGALHGDPFYVGATLASQTHPSKQPFSYANGSITSFICGIRASLHVL